MGAHHPALLAGREPPERAPRLTVVKIAAAALVLSSLTAGCSGNCDEGARFSNSMASFGGYPTSRAAVDAAGAEDASNFPFDIPTTAWSVVRQTEQQHTYQSGDVALTLLLLEDRTWAVESGRCTA